jgi:flagellar protein FliL
MADEKEKKEPEAKDDAAENKEEESGSAGGDDKAKAGGGGGLAAWLIIGGISLVGMVGGFALAQLMASPAEEDVVAEEPEEMLEESSYADLYAETPEEDKPWSYQLDSIIGNLDEPGSSRYLKVGIALEISSELDKDKSIPYLDEKKPIINDFVTTYVAGLSLERVRGSSNLNRIKKELRDAFNDLLFPDGKPLVQRVYLKEFAVQ